MNYFAKLESNGKVVAIYNVHENDSPTEEQGKIFLNNLCNHSFWSQCWKDHSKRKHMAGIGMTYDEIRDAFILKQPYSSWTLNETTCNWEPPTPKPDDGEIYIWNEETKQWEQWNPSG
jgi:hypothetical protein